MDGIRAQAEAEQARLTAPMAGQGLEALLWKSADAEIANRKRASALLQREVNSSVFILNYVPILFYSYMPPSLLSIPSLSLSSFLSLPFISCSFISNLFFLFFFSLQNSMKTHVNYDSLTTHHKGARWEKTATTR